MQKPAKILLWVSLGIGVLHAIAALIAMFVGGTFSPVGAPDGSVYAIFIILYVIKVGIPLVVKIIFAAIVLSGLKEKSEKIVAEITAIVLFSGLLSIPSILIGNIANIFVARMSGEMALISYSYMNTGMTWVSFLHSISTILFIVAVSFAIAYKKIEIPDLRRILEEEES